MTGQEAAFLILAVIGGLAALLVVTSRNVVHAALWLVVALASVAGVYLLLAAPFVAFVQVIIYVGAIVVLLLFGIMLTRAPIGPSTDLDSGNRLAAFAVGLGTAGTLVTVLLTGLRHAYFNLGDNPGGGTARSLGDAIFRYWVLPFELLSVLLLAALVGAIVLSRTNIGRVAAPEDDSASEQRGRG